MQFIAEIELDFDRVSILGETKVRAELHDLAGKLADVLNLDKPIAENDAAYLHAMLSHIVSAADKPARPSKVAQEAAHHAAAVTKKAAGNAKRATKVADKVMRTPARDGGHSLFTPQGNLIVETNRVTCAT